MSWLMLAALGMIWAASFLPTQRRKASPNRSVEDFGRTMEMLAGTERRSGGRWIITPRKGIAFLGPQGRAKARARERRRRVFVFLLESIGLSFLIGLVPPLHAMWYATAVLLMLLGAYVWLLLSLKHQGVVPVAEERARYAQAPRYAPRQARPRYVADGPVARRAFNGLGAVDPHERVDVVVRSGGPLGAARV